ncbi:MAG: DMT family transporter [Clostridia bacterium]|nr:DMT family transporter [Clostridia bacterium]
MKNKRILGDLLLLLTAFIWGVSFVGQRVGMDRIEPISFNAARQVPAAIAVGLVSIIKNRTDKTERSTEHKRNTLIGGICCGTALAFASITQQMGLVYTTAGKAGFITAMYIIIVPVISFFIFRRKVSWLVWVSVITGVAGMYLLCIKDGFKLENGDTLIVICAFLFAGHILCCDYFSPRGDPIRMSAIQFMTAGLISAVIAFIAEEPNTDKIISAIIPILYCGLISGGAGYTLQLVGQKYTEPSEASLIMSLESVFAVLAGAAVLGERMTGREIIGCVIMFSAIIIVQIPKNNS